MTQLDLAGMPARLFACSPSRLAAWLDCPRRYRMAYLDRPPPPKGRAWAHHSLGVSVHTALAAWFQLPPRERTVAAAGRLLVAGWVPDGYRDDAQAATWQVRAREMVEQYVARLDPLREPVGVERTVAFRTDRLAFSGRVDRLDRRGDELVVVDYKTGRHVLSTDDVRGSLALALYARAAAATLRSECRWVELHHLPTGQVFAWPHTAAWADRQLQRAEQVAAEAAAAEVRWRDGDAGAEPFPTRPGPQCRWCDYLPLCADGQAVARPAEPWAGLAEEEP